MPLPQIRFVCEGGGDKWNFVIEVMTCRARAAAKSVSWLRLFLFFALSRIAEHDEIAPEFGQDNLCRVPLDAISIGPFAGLQLAFQIDPRSLFEVLFGDLS